MIVAVSESDASAVRVAYAAILVFSGYFVSSASTMIFSPCTVSTMNSSSSDDDVDILLLFITLIKNGRTH